MDLNHIMKLISFVSIVDIVFVVWSKIDGLQIRCYLLPI